MPPETKTITLHDFQSQAMRSQARFVALIAGTGGGKTFFGPPWLCNEIAKHPNDQWLILAPTYKILSRATMPTFLQFVEGTQFEGKYTESRGVYELPDGGIIYCLSADNWKSVEGGQYQGAWLDEAGQMGHMVWVAVQARLGLKQGRCLFTTTPYPTADADWLLVDIVLQAREEEENAVPDKKREFFCIQYKSNDNPYYPTEEFERMKKVLPPALFQMRYMGLFTKLSGLVYPEYDSVITTDDYNPVLTHARANNWEFFGGLDFGFRDPFVALVAAEDPSTKILHLLYEHYLARTTIPRHYKTLKKASMVDDVVFFGDPSGAQQIADMHSFGMSIIPANNDILAGIETTSARIMGKGIKIYRKACPNLCRELAIYRYASEEEDGMQVRSRGEKPIDKDNHATDALRYLIRGMDGDTISTAYTQEDEPKKKKDDIVHQRYSDGPSLGSKPKTPQEVLEKRKSMGEADEYDPVDLSVDWCTPENPAVWQIHGD